MAWDSAGRLECSTTPVMGDAGHLERQWRAAAARRQRQRLAERGSAIIRIADDALGGFPEGCDGVGGLQRLWQFCCCCTRAWWQSVAGRFASRSLATPWARIDLLLTCAFECTSRSSHTAGGTSGIVGWRTWRRNEERCLWHAAVGHHCQWVGALMARHRLLRDRLARYGAGAFGRIRLGRACVQPAAAEPRVGGLRVTCLPEKMCICASRPHACGMGHSDTSIARYACAGEPTAVLLCTGCKWGAVQ